MSEYRRCRTPGGTYFFTVVTHERRPILCQDGVADQLLAIISVVAEEIPFQVEAYALLPDHLHCIWRLGDDTCDFSRAWALVKLRFTKRMVALSSFRPETETRSRSKIARSDSAIWQRRFWEHKIRNEADFEAHFHYIHFNPVKHGLVRRPMEWRHSTFHRYVEEGIYAQDWGGLDEWPEGIGNE
ncbi:MAG: transposase [Candidatus Zixiibacteriota bacterium]